MEINSRWYKKYIIKWLEFGRVLELYETFLKKSNLLIWLGMNVEWLEVNHLWLFIFGF